MWIVPICVLVFVRERLCWSMRLCVFVRGVLYDVVWFGVAFVLSACVFVIKCVCVLRVVHDVVLYGVLLWFVCACACDVLVVYCEFGFVMYCAMMYGMCFLRCCVCLCLCLCVCVLVWDLLGDALCCLCDCGL